MLSFFKSRFPNLFDLFFGKGFDNPYLIQNSKGIGLDVNKYLRSPEGREAFRKAGETCASERCEAKNWGAKAPKGGVR